MARNGYFSHQSAGGESPADRLSAAGILWTRVGENIANCETVTQAESTFMDEPRFERNHRWNILNPDYTALESESREATTECSTSRKTSRSFGRRPRPAAETRSSQRKPEPDDVRPPQSRAKRSKLLG
jgi:hypothetical protein